MAREVLTDGSGKWFDTDKAAAYSERTRWGGSNYISLATGSQWEHEALYKTVGGLYILNHWSQYQGSLETYEQVSASDAAQWLTRNEYFETGDTVLQAKIDALEIV